MLPISKNWEKFSHLFAREEISAKTLLLQEGQIANTIFLIEKGSLRSWFNNDGKEVTFQFFFEGQGVSSIESFITNEPSLFNIESLEPCVIYTLSKKDFQTLTAQEPAIKEEINAHILQRLFLYQKLFLSRIKDNPEKRYKEMLKEYPEIFQRVPQHYIASYLGITSVSLSRIRNRR
ncbi:CRP-like cAMP-binding protein [Runella defluvii]|uniref:CRP-like cAMP-binding protein n=1 Tax=Runella defluvii TaxID=370973 RepID=A0A7W5ZNU7_9BACT|nr:Crp/Fnr family transcriptional regulator [Runella defluvii]MBB3840040.1 CRP-like cAMP-binding protein [Runella defluvii]